MRVLKQFAVLALLGAAGVAARACAPKADLDAATNQVAHLQSENAKLKADLEARSAIPVVVKFRRAYAAAGYVAVLDTTIKSPLAVLLTRTSKALGTVSRYELHLDPDVTTELGGLDGVVFELGDVVKLENNDYSPTITIVEAP